jgi:hypothetical protein
MSNNAQRAPAIIATKMDVINCHRRAVMTALTGLSMQRRKKSKVASQTCVFFLLGAAAQAGFFPFLMSSLKMKTCATLHSDDNILLPSGIFEKCDWL